MKSENLKQFVAGVRPRTLEPMQTMKKQTAIVRPKYSIEEISQMVRRVEHMKSKGISVKQASRSVGVNVNTYYSWRKKIQRINKKEAHDIAALKEEIQKLKKIVAELILEYSRLNNAKAKKASEKAPERSVND